MSRNLLLIGSESYVCRDYINRFSNQYDNIVGIDIAPKSSNLDIYLSVDFRKKNCFRMIEHFLESISVSFSQIIFASGVNYINNIFDVTLYDWDTTFEINIRSIVFTLKSCFDYFQSSVSIALLSSQNGIVGHESRIDYGPSKSALIQLAKNLSVDYSSLKNMDVRVNCISPSYIINESNKYFLSTHAGKKLLRRIPYSKFVTLEDVSNSLNFILGKESRAIRGQNIVIDYGYTII